jgi:streptomycin 6-kinase
VADFTELKDWHLRRSSSNWPLAGSSDVRERVSRRVQAWNITVEHTAGTPGAVIVFGTRGDEPVVMKVFRSHGDEWGSGEVLRAFAGEGMVRLLNHADGAVLLERLTPGTSLADVAVDDDERATGILIDVMQRLSSRTIPDGVPSVEEWGKGFVRYATTQDVRVPRPLLESAQRVYQHLCATQAAAGLLHGDLHHFNVLTDKVRGWTAIDPKGIVGEQAYETGAALRNPWGSSEIFTDRSVIVRRASRFAKELSLDEGRVLGWAFAQAVLSAVWAIEDGGIVHADSPWLVLANTIRPMLKGVVDV